MYLHLLIDGEIIELELPSDTQVLSEPLFHFKAGPLHKKRVDSIALTKAGILSTFVDKWTRRGKIKAITIGE
jgi:hypothetical protein